MVYPSVERGIQVGASTIKDIKELGKIQRPEVRVMKEYTTEY